MVSRRLLLKTLSLLAASLLWSEVVWVTFARANLRIISEVGKGGKDADRAGHSSSRGDPEFQRKVQLVDKAPPNRLHNISASQLRNSSTKEAWERDRGVGNRHGGSDPLGRAVGSHEGAKQQQEEFTKAVKEIESELAILRKLGHVEKAHREVSKAAAHPTVLNNLKALSALHTLSTDIHKAVGSKSDPRHDFLSDWTGLPPDEKILIGVLAGGVGLSAGLVLAAPIYATFAFGAGTWTEAFLAEMTLFRGLAAGGLAVHTSLRAAGNATKTVLADPQDKMAVTFAPLTGEAKAHLEAQFEKRTAVVRAVSSFFESEAW